MARYIDADALLQRLPDNLPYKASVKRVLMQAPTADVATRIEVAREFVKRFEYHIKDCQLTLGQAYDIDYALKKAMEETKGEWNNER